MRRSLCLLMLGGFLSTAVGCAQTTKEMLVINRSAIRGTTQDRTMTESYTEHMHRLNAVVDQDSRMIVEDLDLLWQRDRPSRLTRWATP